MSIRTERIAEQIRGELARLLREEVHDPRIRLLSITRVKVSPDLSTALVFWSPLDVDADADPEDIAEGLESAAGFLRRQIGGALPLRRTPALSFRFDPSIREGARMLTLIRELPEVQHPRDDADGATEDPGASAGRDAEARGAGADGEET